MSEEEIEEIETLEIDFKDTDELELALEVSSKKAIYLIDDLIKHLFELQQENQSLKKENKILRENAEHNDKVVDKVNWENQELKKQLEYLRSGEYLNQLRFERDMLQDLVDKKEISKEDKEFIDMTHRNTELLEQNQKLKKQLKEYKRLGFEHLNN